MSRVLWTTLVRPSFVRAFKKPVLHRLTSAYDWFVETKTRSAFLLALYGSSAILLFAYEAGAWNEWIAVPLQLGARNEHVTVVSAVLMAVPSSVLLFGLVYMVTVESHRRQKKYGNTQYYRRMKLTSPAEIASVVNAATLLGLSLIAWYWSGLLDWGQVGYTVSACVIFGLGTFYSIDSPVSETPLFSKANTIAKREALKLQAELFRDLVQAFGLGSLSIFILVLTYLVFQVIQNLSKGDTSSTVGQHSSDRPSDSYSVLCNWNLGVGFRIHKAIRKNNSTNA